MKLSVADPLRASVGALKVSVMAGGHVTLRFADAVLPFPPFADVTALVVLVKSPPEVPVTFKLNVQEAFAASVAPARVTAFVPGTALIAPPPHDPVRPFGLLTCIPDGKESVNPTPVSATALLLVIVKLRVVLPFKTMREAWNDLLMEGGSSTVRLAVAVVPEPPSFEVTLPVVLFRTPAAVPVTLTEKVHDALTAKLAPESATLVAPGTAVMVPPPQEPVKPFGDATARPGGNASENPTPETGIAFAAGFVMVKLKVVLAFSATVGVPNDFAIVGGTATVTVAVLLAAPAPVSLAEIGPVVFDCNPGLIPVTLSEKVQKPLAVMVAPDKLIVVPAAEIAPPPHDPVKPLGDVTARPDGSTSVNAIFVRV